MQRESNTRNRQGSGTQKLATPGRRSQNRRSCWTYGKINRSLHWRKQKSAVCWIRSSTIHMNRSSSAGKIQFGRRLHKQPGWAVGNHQGSRSVKKIDFPQNTPRAATIFTESRITIDSIRNIRNHNHLVEEIRKNINSLERADWNIEISWVKVHVLIFRNELADRLAKDAACDSVAKIVFHRIPITTLISKIEHETKLQWQKERKECTKAGITKECFPMVNDRQKININITPIFKAMATGHGKPRAYIHRFKIL